MKIAVATLGCKVNQYESAGIMEALEASACKIVAFDEEADFYIVNTCTVTGRSDAQSRRLIRQAAKTNPDGQIIVTGCYARRAAAELKKIPGVALVTDRKDLIPQTVAAAASGKLTPESPADAFCDPACLKPTRFPGHTRAFLKIQDGCNSRCRYCIVPLVRGPSRSIPQREVISRINELNHAGFREVVLTGIHLGAYGADLAPPTELTDVVKTIVADRAVLRLRLSSIEPLEITDSLIALLQHSDILCRHLHIPLQSGDDVILKEMGRPYDTGYFRQLLEKIQKAVPDLAIGLDVMAGFPGEDEQAFNRTMQFIAALPVAYLHVFPYSERPGTAAAAMPGKISAVEKKYRVQALRDLGKEKRTAFAERFVGRNLQVLVEGKPDSEMGMWRGFSGNYIPVLLEDGDVSLVNQIVAVTAHRCFEGKLYGRTMHA